MNMNKIIEYHYDKEADVMYLSIDKPQPAFTMKIAEDFSTTLSGIKTSRRHYHH